MLKVLNQQLQPVAVLENASGIGYTKTTNELWTASFTLPLNDPKNEEYNPAELNQELNNHEINTVCIGDIILSRIDVKAVVPVVEIIEEEKEVEEGTE